MRGRFAVVLLALLASPALAEEAGTALRAKALAAAPVAAQEPAHEAPKADPYAAIFAAPPVVHVTAVDACGSTRTLCYDANERRIVYRGAKSLMPAMPGLTAESVALRRDRVVLRYSFR